MRRMFLAATLALLLGVATVPPVHASPPQWATIGHHTVRHGETIYCIGRAYGVLPNAIASYNGIVNPNQIYAGQVLAIPDAYGWIPAGRTCTPQWDGDGQTCSTYHTVVSGENLYRISLHYNVSMWSIAERNNIYNLNYIRIGDLLCIP